MKSQPHWVNKSLYPFQSRWVSIGGADVHYIDEGEGPTILFLHGTPEWSFGYRDVILELRKHYRCVAWDMLGFGLSDKPAHADYTVAAHAERLLEFFQTLNLSMVTVVSNDFGGALPFYVALKKPGRVARLVLFNSWMRSLQYDRHFSRPAKAMSGWLGRFLYLHLNFPVNIVMPAAFGDKRKLTTDAHNHYRKALPRGQRHATWKFATELMDASPWWERLWQEAPAFEHIPMLIFWGMKDRFVPASELDRWRAQFPWAETIMFDDAGHFLQEEKPHEMASAIRGFVGI